MKAPAVPPNDAERLAALASYRVLDTAPEPDFDGLTKRACRCRTTASARGASWTPTRAARSVRSG
jgi:hypothetical protein